MVIVSLFRDGAEIEQHHCESPEDAARMIADGNARAVNRYRWGLSPINFLHDDGTQFSVDEANAVRRACGCAEY